MVQGSLNLGERVAAAAGCNQAEIFVHHKGLVGEFGGEAGEQLVALVVGVVVDGGEDAPFVGHVFACHFVIVFKHLLYADLLVVAADEVEAGVLQGALGGIFWGVFIHGDLFAAFIGLLGFAGVEGGGKQLAVQAVGERV